MEGHCWEILVVDVYARELSATASFHRLKNNNTNNNN